MVQIHPEYIVDENSYKKAVIIPFTEWERIMDEMEELDDIRAYDAVKNSADDSIPFEQAIKEIESGLIK